MNRCTDCDLDMRGEVQLAAALEAANQRVAELELEKALRSQHAADKEVCTGRVQVCVFVYQQ